MIELQIFFYTEDTHALEKVGIPTSLEANELRPMMFYNIDAIAPHIDGEKEYCAVHTSGKEFICNLTFMEVKELISLQKALGE